MALSETEELEMLRLRKRRAGAMSADPSLVDQIPDMPIGRSKPAQEPSWRDKLIGAGETARAVAAGIPAGIGGSFVGLLKGLTGGKLGTAEGVREAGETVTLVSRGLSRPPGTETGKEYTGRLGELLESTKIAGLSPEAALSIGAITPFVGPQLRPGNKAPAIKPGSTKFKAMVESTGVKPPVAVRPMQPRTPAEPAAAAPVSPAVVRTPDQIIVEPRLPVMPMAAADLGIDISDPFSFMSKPRVVPPPVPTQIGLTLLKRAELPPKVPVSRSRIRPAPSVKQEPIDPSEMRAIENMVVGAGWDERGGGLQRSGVAAPSDNAMIGRYGAERAADEAWLEQAGRMGEAGEVVGRNVWIPGAAWFQEMRQELGPKGLTNQSAIREAVEKLKANEKLNANERRTIEWMRDDYKKNVELDLKRIQEAEGLKPIASELELDGLAAGDGVDASLVARAAEIDDGAVERLAIQFGDDDAGFMQGIKEIIDGAN